MRTEDLITRATTIADLHARRRPLVLPTVWDVWSARAAVDAGFEALTIGSHPLADSRGAKDNEGQSLDDVVAAVAPITGAVDVPVSVDLEAGYGRSPQELVAGLLVAGGVGLNIEDTVHSEGGRLRAADEHAELVAGLREAATAAGVPVWINGRTDLFMHAEDPARVLDEAIARLQGLVAAGADSVYPVRIQDSDELITVVVSALDVPVNCTAHPVKHDLARFAGLGVGRITFGPLLQAALSDEMRRMFVGWRD